MKVLRQVITDLTDHGFLVSTPSAVLTGSETDHELAAALQNRITICPVFDMDPVAIFDGYTFDAPHLVTLLQAVTRKLISWG